MGLLSCLSFLGICVFAGHSLLPIPLGFLLVYGLMNNPLQESVKLALLFSSLAFFLLSDLFSLFSAKGRKAFIAISYVFHGLGLSFSLYYIFSVLLANNQPISGGQTLISWASIGQFIVLQIVIISIKAVQGKGIWRPRQ